MDKLKDIPVEAIYSGLACAGGIARYLSGVRAGQTVFSKGMLLASALMAMFSGVMFALFAESLDLPVRMCFMFSGLGGFFGDQALKFLYERITNVVVK